MAKANGKAPKRERKPVQNWLPDTEPETIPEVEQAVLAYEEAKEEDKEARKEFKAKDLALMDKLRSNKLDQYQSASGMIYKLNNKPVISRKKKKKVKHPVTGAMV